MLDSSNMTAKMTGHKKVKKRIAAKTGFKMMLNPIS
jgi:hypothetical protein